MSGSARCGGDRLLIGCSFVTAGGRGLRDACRALCVSASRAVRCGVVCVCVCVFFL